MSALIFVDFMGRRERNKAEKLARIESAARRLFGRHGYEATTTRAIASEADIATGTLFRYFPEKRDLAIHLVRQSIDAAVDRGFALAADEPEPADAIVSLFTEIFGAYEAEPDLSRVFVKELLFLEGQTKIDYAVWTISFMQRLASLLARMRREGALGGHVETSTAAYQIFAQYYLALVSWLGNATLTPAQRDVLFRASIDQLVAGLAPHSNMNGGEG